MRWQTGCIENIRQEFAEFSCFLRPIEDIDHDNGHVEIELSQKLSARSTWRDASETCNRDRPQASKTLCHCGSGGGSFGAHAQGIAGVLDIASNDHFIVLDQQRSANVKMAMGSIRMVPGVDGMTYQPVDIARFYLRGHGVLSNSGDGE